MSRHPPLVVKGETHYPLVLPDRICLGCSFMQVGGCSFPTRDESSVDGCIEYGRKHGAGVRIWVIGKEGLAQWTAERLLR